MRELLDKPKTPRDLENKKSNIKTTYCTPKLIAVMVMMEEDSTVCWILVLWFSAGILGSLLFLSDMCATFIILFSMVVPDLLLILGLRLFTLLSY